MWLLATPKLMVYPSRAKASAALRYAPPEEARVVLIYKNKS